MYGIIGFPLTHTFSPAYFTEKFRQLGIADTYRPFPLADIAGLPALLRQFPALKGLNVTIPYKQSVIPYLDALDDTAAQIGAVNTIRIQHGRLTGYNTDTLGFTASLQPELPPFPLQALVLGTGGSSRAVAYSLGKLGIPFLYVSRRAGEGRLRYTELDAAVIDRHRLIVNTTPLGMSPDEDSCPPIPYHFLSGQHLLYDLVYVPAETLFLRKGKAQGAAVKNGYDMLTGQAEAAWAIWNA